MVSKVKIGPLEYSVTAVPRPTIDGRECYGTINYSETEIKINNDNSDERDKATLMHEIVHGIAEQHKIELTEEATDMLALGFLALVRDNVPLIQYLWEV